MRVPFGMRAWKPAFPEAVLGIQSMQNGICRRCCLASIESQAAVSIPPPSTTHPGSAARHKSSGSFHEPRGWHSRGYLPHCDVPGLIQSIVFRLYDSVPNSVLSQWKKELEWHPLLSAGDDRSNALRQRIAAYEDAGHGCCWLGRPEIASCMQAALWFFDGSRYRLLAWCVMPNHVHVLIESQAGFPVGKIVRSWKSHVARHSNRLLGRSGQPFWGADYFDRFIRDDAHFRQAVAYIHENPVAARLVGRAGDWPWSSAAFHSAAIRADT